MQELTTISLKTLLHRIGVHSAGIKIMLPKGRFRVVLIRDLKPVTANILKQECLALGAECALHEHSITHKVDKTHAIIMATESQYRRLIDNLKIQPFGLPQIGIDLENLLFTPANTYLHMAHGQSLDLTEKTAVMGILNLTPDSFSDGGQFISRGHALKRAEEMITEGADIIDIGGESTRPGAEAVSENEELDRVIPVVEALAGTVPLISVDTTKAAVAEAALNAGAHIINDIFGFHQSPELAHIAAKHQAGAILMHIKGNPRTMQKNPQYDDLMGDILDWLAESIQIAVKAGLPQNHLVVDPGIGFGKTPEHNLEILRRLGELSSLKVPILIGVSRKSFIGKIDGSHVTNRLGGSLAAAVTSVLNGASIVRVHDVKETVQAMRMVDAISRDKHD
ncbi:MAG: Dihydropteroate synthase [Marinimicrobia bacterium 46_47]|nr:MAG: Dihydropteroate synthase [Marinimicrobia bacterium 46_47]KUK91553.1 MAG: dihydropteroate synthase [Marinimicrobia bacterium 46_43]HBY19053.1 dihydropteroate synthase [Candidatus Neomarinimicrobiota bacterium]